MCRSGRQDSARFRCTQTQQIHTTCTVVGAVNTEPNQGYYRYCIAEDIMMSYHLHHHEQQQIQIPNQLAQQQQQPQQQPTQPAPVPVLAEPVACVVPCNIPTKLNNTIATSTRVVVRAQQEPGVALPIDYEPTNLDVCSGRGKRNWNHSGNVAFRDLIQHATPSYMSAATKNDKTSIVCNIVEEMRTIGCKFLKEDIKSGRWYDIGDAQAREKVGHSLRDQVTAYNRLNNATPNTTDVDTETTTPTATSPTKHQRTLSDSGKEADARRMSLDTTVLLGQFARRPSWIAQAENDILYNAASTTTITTTGNHINHQTSNNKTQPPPPQQQQQQQSMANINNGEFIANQIDYTKLSGLKNDTSLWNLSKLSMTTSSQPIADSIAPPSVVASTFAELPYEIRKQQQHHHHHQQQQQNSIFNNETTKLDPTTTTSTGSTSGNVIDDFPQPQNRNPRESISMEELKNWNPRMLEIGQQSQQKGATDTMTNTCSMDGMLQESVESWDPRLSSTTSMMSIRRSQIMNMAGSTTLRRLTNGFQASDVSIVSFMEGLDFGDDYDDSDNVFGTGTVLPVTEGARR